MTRRSLRRALLLLLALAQPASADDLTLQEFAARAYPAVVKVVSSGRSADDQPHTRQGTGLLVHPDGWVLTAAHNIGRDSEWLVGLPSTEPIRVTEVISVGAGGVETSHSLVKIEAIDFERDVALLRVSATGLPSLWLSGPAHAERGARVMAMGWGENRSQAEPLDGTIANVSDPANAGLLKLDLGARPGDSGGPVVDAHGHFVGVIVEGRTDVPGAVYVSPSLSTHPERGKIPSSRIPFRFETHTESLLREGATVELRRSATATSEFHPFRADVGVQPDQYSATPALDRPTMIPARPVVVTAGSRSFTLDYAVDLYGNVLDENGQGLQGMRVRIGNRTSDPTLDDGGFVLRDLPLDDFYEALVFSEESQARYIADRPFRALISNDTWSPAFSKTIRVRIQD